MRRYGLIGPTTGDLLTLGGKVLWHHDRAELEWLVPYTRTVELPPDLEPAGCLPISQHPGLAHVTFPLRREEFQR